MTKVALVTGVSKGIGLSIASQLIKDGYKVYGISRTKPFIDAQSFTWLQLDLLSAKEIKTLSNTIAEKEIDLLVNNAGLVIKRDALDFDQKTFDTTFGLNLIAPILVCQTLIQKLQKATIINISSLSDRIPDSNFALYCASKAALNIYFDSIQTKHTNLRLIHILPSYVDTPLLRDLVKDEPFEWEKIIQPSDIADIVLRVEKDTSLPNKSRIFVITDAMKEDANNPEDIYVYNSTNKSLIALEEFLRFRA